MNAAPVVLLHGWGLTPAVWAGLRAALPRALEVHSPSLPGHDDAVAAVDSDRLEDWSDALVSHIPDGAVVCGWSLGGMIAMDLARRHPDKVSRLVLIGSSPRFVADESGTWPHGLPGATVQGFVDSFQFAPEATLKRFIALQTLGDTRRRVVGSALTESLPSLDDARAAALTHGLLVLAGSDLRAAVGDIRRPVTLIHGAGDALMPIGAARWLVDHLPSAHLVVMDHCGHAPFLSDPGACVAQLLQAYD